MRNDNIVRNDGNCLSFNFINTIHNRHSKKLLDYVRDNELWMRWLSSSGFGQIFELTEADETRLIEIRELLYRLTTALLEESTPRKSDLKCYNVYLNRLEKQYFYTIEHGAYKEMRLPGVSLVDRFNDEVLRDFHVVLGTRRSQIKVCGNCGWLFLDKSKNRSRKWCNMSVCGNEIKARRFYHKSKENSTISS